MKKLICIIILSFFSVIILHAQVVSNNEVIVRFSQKAETKNSLTGISSFDNVISRYNVQKITPVLENKEFYIYHILCEKKLNFEELKNLVNIKSEIIYVQPNYINKMLSVTPNDPKYYKQWGLEAIRANKAWDIEKGNEQVVIGLIDSGVDYNHPDLVNNIWINPDEIPDNGIDDDNNGFIDDWQGWDFTDTEMLDALGDCRERDDDPMDDLGHGTHCAGIISAQTNNNLGVAGVTWFCKLMNIRAGFRTTAGGFLEDDDVSSAILYAADNGAQIISISWGDTQLAPVIRDVCQYAFDMGVVIIASAGNEAGAGLLYPAALNNIISATAVDEDLSLCSFSSYGEGIDLCAPGLNITSTYLNNDYKEESGTSMSAPFVSGAVALLLSQNPLLTNDETYNLLQNSCDDLGDIGYDNQFGYGIINIEKLLINSTKSNQIEAEISSPKYNDGFHQNFPIIGNAYCPEFFHYSVTFTDKPNPEENDWLDIVTHNPTPYYYDTLVFDDTLAFFNTEGIADSTYYLRLSVKDINGNNFVDIIKVNIDKSPPEFIENTTSISTRYNFDKKNYYILSVTDEPVKFKATCFSSEVDSFLIIDNKFSQVASLRLPENLPDTQLSFFIEITNKSGLSNSTEIFYDTINIDNSSIATSGFEKLFEYPNAGYLCPNNYDINNNGKKELVFMEFPEEGTYGEVKFCEENNNDLIVKYTMPVEFQPWSIGDSNGDGKFEIVGNIGDSILIYEATSDTTFPDSFIFGKRGIGGLYGCAFQDLNGNGSDELLINTILDSQKTAYKIYTRVNNDFVYSDSWLLNNTHTYSKNQLTPHIQFGDLDNDEILDILLSDIDGDILIYEAKSLNSLNFEIKDTLSIPVPYAYYSGIGDFNGDDTTEFVVGGYHEDIMNPDNQLWYFGVFKSSGDNQYEMVDFAEISGVCSKNGLCVADLDPDKHNGDEVIIAASPDIYIYKLQNNEFKPIWVGSSYRSYYPVSLDLDNDNINESVAFNQKDESVSLISSGSQDGQDSLRLVLYHYPEDIVDVPIPQNFRAIPINKNSIRLNWRSISDIDSFKIYRISSFDSISFSLDDTINTFIDTSVFADSFYFYQASAIKNGIEGYKTLKKLAVPSAPPILDSIKMISLNSIQLDFKEPLNESCLNIANYKIKNFGYPESAVLGQSRKRILLGFSHLFSEEHSPYTIKIKYLESLYHTPMQDTIATFIYEEDVTRPYIKDCTYLTKKEIQLTFSESIKQSSAINIENYELIFPEEVEECEVISVSYDDNNNKVIIKLSIPLKPIGKSYFIKVSNIEDLSGNIILPGKNIVKISIPIENLDAVEVFPNPVLANQNKLYFQNLPTSGKANIYIYNFAGEPVKKITTSNLTEGYNTAEWNLCNSSEKKVASGIYFYLIKYNDKVKKGKIGIIK